MAHQDIPVTSAVRCLREHNISFTPHVYAYKEHGGTAHSAVALGVPEHGVVKTLVFLADGKRPILVLMHGDMEVSAKGLGRQIGAKSVEQCDERTAQRYTGYVFGGTSPFGTRVSLPVYVEKTIFDLETIYINGGKRGFLVQIHPQDLRKAFSLSEVTVGISGT